MRWPWTGSRRLSDAPRRCWYLGYAQDPGGSEGLILRQPFGGPENPALKQVEERSWRFANSFSGATQKVNNNREDSEKRRVTQGVGAVSAEPFTIAASTPYDFTSRNLTAYGGLLPIATMLE